MPEIDPDVPWGWAYASKCYEHDDPDIFYPERNRKTYKHIANRARAICFGRDGQPACPVRFECLLDAVKVEQYEEEHPEDKEKRMGGHGIWGGLSHRERNHLRREWKRLAPELDLETYVRQTVGAHR